MSEGYRLDARNTAFGGWTVFFLLVTLATVAASPYAQWR